MKHIEKKVDLFLKRHHRQGSPLIVALSGGSDSLALFHLLLEIRELYALDLHAAHVDHRWRRESAVEAAQLKTYVERHGIPFHLKVLEPFNEGPNAEALCRKARMAFFQELSHHLGAQAVIKGHQCDDQAETVLKRLFEGAPLPSWGAMREVSSYETMTIWRPLLSVGKKELEAWLTIRSIPWFEDATNGDERFLRARMRKKIIPTLTQQFGKEVAPALLRFAEQAQEIESYLRQKINGIKPKASIGPWGSMWDLSCCFSMHSIECSFLVRVLLGTLSNAVVEAVSSALASCAADKMFGKNIYVDRGKLFLLQDRKMPQWKITVERGSVDGASSWKEAWEGRGYALLPEGEYSLSQPQPSLPYGKTTTLDVWWTKHKVPALMRSLVPVVVDINGIVVHEFLTGRTKAFGNRSIKIVVEGARTGVT